MSVLSKSAAEKSTRRLKVYVSLWFSRISRISEWKCWIREAFGREGKKWKWKNLFLTNEKSCGVNVWECVEWNLMFHRETADFGRFIYSVRKFGSRAWWRKQSPACSANCGRETRGGACRLIIDGNPQTLCARDAFIPSKTSKMCFDSLLKVNRSSRGVCMGDLAS